MDVDASTRCLKFLCAWHGFAESTWELPWSAGFTARDMSYVHAFMLTVTGLELLEDRVRHGVSEHLVRFTHGGRTVEGWVGLTGTCGHLDAKVRAYSEQMDRRERELLDQRREMVKKIGFDPYVANFSVGQDVTAQFRPDGKYYPATVTEALPDGRFMLEWRDGDRRDVGPRFGCRMRSCDDRISHLEDEIRKLRQQLSSQQLSSKPERTPQKRTKANKGVLVSRLNRLVARVSEQHGLPAVLRVAEDLVGKGRIPYEALLKREGEAELDLELLDASDIQTLIAALQSMPLTSPKKKPPASPPFSPKRNLLEAQPQSTPKKKRLGADDDSSSSSGSSITSDDLYLHLQQVV